MQTHVHIFESSQLEGSYAGNLLYNTSQGPSFWDPSNPSFQHLPAPTPSCCSHKKHAKDAMFLWLHMCYSPFCFLTSPQLGEFSPCIISSRNSSLPPSKLNKCSTCHYLIDCGSGLNHRFWSLTPWMQIPALPLHHLMTLDKSPDLVPHLYNGTKNSSWLILITMYQAPGAMPSTSQVLSVSCLHAFCLSVL